MFGGRGAGEVGGGGGDGAAGGGEVAWWRGDGEYTTVVDCVETLVLLSDGIEERVERSWAYR